jgi:hypothetical protein
MRYFIAILLCAAALWAIFGDQDKVSKKSPKSEGNVQIVDGTPEPNRDNSSADKDLASLAMPATSDPLAATIQSILAGLIEGEAAFDQRDALEAKLVQAMLDENMADKTTLGNAARTTIDRMFSESESARSAGAGSGPMTSFQTQATISMANKISGSLRRAMRATKDGTVHEGPLLSLDFDFDVPDGYAKASWDILGGFRYVEGMELPAKVMALNNKKVGLAGYMMALGEFEDIHIFAVVESQWSCCFGTPPDIHQIVEVILPDTDPGIELVAVPILVLGTLKVGEIVEDGWVISVHRMKAETIDVLE